MYVCGLKFERGNKPTAWSQAPEDVKEYTDKAIDEIQIGGVNLIDDTDKGSHEKFAGYNGSSVSSGTATVEEFGNITCGTITTSGGTSSLKALRTPSAISSEPTRRPSGSFSLFMIRLVAA